MFGCSANVMWSWDIVLLSAIWTNCNEELAISSHSLSYDSLLLILPINPQKSLLLRFIYSVRFWDLCEISLPSYTAGETEWCYIRSDKVHTQTQYVCCKIRSNATREWFVITLNIMEEDLDLFDRNWISWSSLTNTSSLSSRGAKIHHLHIPVWLKGPII